MYAVRIIVKLFAAFVRARGCLTRQDIDERSSQSQHPVLRVPDREETWNQRIDIGTRVRATRGRQMPYF